MALSHELYLSALALALTLPDTCGKAEYPDENKAGSDTKDGAVTMSSQLDVILPMDAICLI